MRMAGGTTVPGKLLQSSFPLFYPRPPAGASNSKPPRKSRHPCQPYRQFCPGPAGYRAGIGRRWRTGTGAHRRPAMASGTSSANRPPLRYQHGRAGGRVVRHRSHSGGDARAGCRRFHLPASLLCKRPYCGRKLQTPPGSACASPGHHRRPEEHRRSLRNALFVDQRRKRVSQPRSSVRLRPRSSSTTTSFPSPFAAWPPT